MNPESTTVSIVIPVYNSSPILPELVRRLQQVRSAFNPSSELVFVDDASKDGSYEALKRLVSNEKNIYLLRLRKNAGVDNAILAGLRATRGKIVVLMDDDLQQAPEDIPRAIGKLQEGFDVVYGKYDKKRQSVLKNTGSYVHDHLAKWVHGKPKGIHLSSFKVLTRSVVEQIIEYRFPYPYIDGLILRSAGSVGFISMIHHERLSGRGNHGLLRSLRIFFNSLTTFSFLPLRLLLLLGLSIFLIGFFLYFKEPISTNTVIFLVSGAQIFGMGLLGEYLGRIYMGLGQKPQYVLEG